MPMSPYILVLAATPQEAAKYIKLAKLPRGRWRIASSASAIRGIRRATVHCLPGFKKRPDKFAVLSVLKYARCDWVDVEMPEEPPVDQGDGMGEQLTLEDALREAYAEEDARREEFEAQMREQGTPVEKPEPQNGDAMENEGAPPLPSREETLERFRRSELVSLPEDSNAEQVDDVPVAPEPPKPRQRRRRQTVRQAQENPPAPATELF